MERDTRVRALSVFVFGSLVQDDDAAEQARHMVGPSVIREICRNLGFLGNLVIHTA